MYHLINWTRICHDYEYSTNTILLLVSSPNESEPRLQHCNIATFVLAKIPDLAHIGFPITNDD